LDAKLNRHVDWIYEEGAHHPDGSLRWRLDELESVAMIRWSKE
jgi:hypothetical protein